jgi:hypothetical protein
MQPDELLETIRDLSALKGFPRNDSRALLVVAESLLDIVQPAQDKPTDDVILDRARRIVAHTIRCAKDGWEGPAQFSVAASSLAESNQRWDIPSHWRMEPLQCSDCTDTGAIQVSDGTFALCLCPAGEGVDALNHVARLNVAVAEARRVREMASRRLH